MLASRQLILFGVLALSAMAHASAQEKNAKAVKASAAPVAQRMHTNAAADLFAPHSWLPPPPKVVARVEIPHAPALPFVYLGKLMQGSAVTAYVSQGANNLALKTGDKVPGYRVEKITASGMTFVYEPLNEKQTLSFGSAN